MYNQHTKTPTLVYKYVRQVGEPISNMRMVMGGAAIVSKATGYKFVELASHNKAIEPHHYLT